MPSAYNILQATARALGLLRLSAVLAFCVAGGMAGETLAAGCHYQLTGPQVYAGGQSGKLAVGAWWAGGAVQCVYADGELTYYQVPGDSLPCNAPGCRGKEPDGQMGSPVMVESQRQTLFGDRSPLATVDSAPPISFERLEEAIPSSPAPSGLLRPPRA